jgi:hypothetical protein
MELRRPIVTLITALTLVGGGTLTACSEDNGQTGTPKDTASNTSGSDPSDESQGNLPDNSNPDEDSDPDSGSGTGDN